MWIWEGAVALEKQRATERAGGGARGGGRERAREWEGGVRGVGGCGGGGGGGGARAEAVGASREVVRAGVSEGVRERVSE